MKIASTRIGRKRKNIRTGDSIPASVAKFGQEFPTKVCQNHFLAGLPMASASITESQYGHLLLRVYPATFLSDTLSAVVAKDWNRR